MRSISAAGGVVQTKDGRILMILRNGVWDLPKGKIESGEAVEEAALREVEEETGLEELTLLSSLGTTIHHYELDGETVEKTTWWYLMGLEAGVDPDSLALHPQQEEGITAVAWKEMQEARQLAGYDNLIQVLDNLSGVPTKDH